MLASEVIRRQRDFPARGLGPLLGPTLAAEADLRGHDRQCES